jgi:hypothetical protein
MLSQLSILYDGVRTSLIGAAKFLQGHVDTRTCCKDSSDGLLAFFSWRFSNHEPRVSLLSTAA